ARGTSPWGATGTDLLFYRCARSNASVDGMKPTRTCCCCLDGVRQGATGRKGKQAFWHTPRSVLSLTLHRLLTLVRPADLDAKPILRRSSEFSELREAGLAPDGHFGVNLRLAHHRHILALGIPPSWHLGLTDSESMKCASRRAKLAHERHTTAHISSDLPVTRHQSRASKPNIASNSDKPTSQH